MSMGGPRRSQYHPIQPISSLERGAVNLHRLQIGASTRDRETRSNLHRNFRGPGFLSLSLPTPRLLAFPASGCELSTPRIRESSNASRSQLANFSFRRAREFHGRPGDQFPSRDTEKECPIRGQLEKFLGCLVFEIQTSGTTGNRSSVSRGSDFQWTFKHLKRSPRASRRRECLFDDNKSRNVGREENGESSGAGRRQSNGN